jgi:hypothetical protein
VDVGAAGDAGDAIVRGVVLALTFGMTSALGAQASRRPVPCAPAGYDRAALVALKQASFAISDSVRRQAFALEVSDCLADADPTVRDGIAFEALQSLMRNQQLTTETVAALRDRLVPWLTGPEGAGFSRPFAALVLADVARTDRVAPWMTSEQRVQFVRAAADYLTNVRDYRGYDETEGWRHGVAHGADLVMQLAFNPAVGRDELALILAAVASQVAPTGHFYMYGEPNRLAAPVLAIARRGLFSPAEWDAWFAQVSGPAPLARWADAYGSQAGLAKRHNTLAFLSFLYLNAKLSGAEPLAPLLPGVEAGLRALP